MRINYITNVSTTWTKKDYDFLNTKFKTCHFHIKSKFHLFKSILNLFFFKSDISFYWFASLNFLPHLLISKLLMKKIVIIAGGFDVVNLPEIKYGGLQGNPLKVFLRKLMLHLADRIISISHSNQEELFQNVPNINKNKCSLILHGFSPNTIELQSFSDREEKIVTIGAVNNETFVRKGIKYFLEVVKDNPSWQFVLIGRVDENFKFKKLLELPNLTCTGFISDDDLIKHVNSSKFYLQLSEHEGFGCSVIDAALLGAFPIGFSNFALTEVIDGIGKTIDKKSSYISEIKNIIQTTDFDPEKVSSIAYSKYPLNTRGEKIVSLIESL